ncbi:MAG: hypothetical protein II330_00650, partial [Clostridia bacterium]|nr:hypothetical protein [Clostridia bacterium]
MMHLIHRNRVIETRAARFCFRCGLICLQISSPEGTAFRRVLASFVCRLNKLYICGRFVQSPL